MQSTEELVVAVRAGDQLAFAQLVRLYERAAVLTAYSVLHDFHAAQDVAQDSFVIAHGKLGQLKSAAAFGPWLLRIVRRQAVRLKRYHSEEPLQGDTPEASAGQPSAWLEQYEAVIDQLARLPEHERVPLVLRYVDGQSVREIADSTGKPVGTIKKQITRALQRLRQWLREVPS